MALSSARPSARRSICEVQTKVTPTYIDVHAALSKNVATNQNVIGREAIEHGKVATEIYARAYNQSPEAVAFYEFTRTMQSYKSIIVENTTLVLSTGSDLFKFLKGMSPDGEVIPAPRPGDNR
jgi:hypothetical protein